MEDAPKKHNIVIENRGKMTVSDVDDVESFDDEKVVIYTTMGTLVITGYDLRLNKLSVDDGQLIIEGEIVSMEYTDSERKSSNGGFFGKLFR